MNKFTALNAIQTATKKVSADQWNTTVNNDLFAYINKSNGMYFAHFKNRTTPLMGHKTFMAALASMLVGFTQYIEKTPTALAAARVLAKAGGFTAVMGNDGVLYVTHKKTPWSVQMPQHDMFAFATEIRREFPSNGEHIETLKNFIKSTYKVLDSITA